MSSTLTAFESSVLNRLQDGIPIAERPYAALARELECAERDIVDCVGSLLERGVLSRFGPMYNAERMGGAFTLCAMAVPDVRFEEVAALVNAYPEVAHNYARQHHLNMWFVLAAEQPQRIGAVRVEIETRTGLAVLDFPKLEEFYVGLKLEV